MNVLSIDHVVLTVASIDKTCAFYCGVLGMERETFGAGRTALKFGRQKFNLHQADNTLSPKADTPTPGSADFCLIVDDLQAAIRAVENAGIPYFEGPSPRTGAMGPITSIYVRDPDQNLVELSVYQAKGA